MRPVVFEAVASAVSIYGSLVDFDPGVFLAGHVLLKSRDLPTHADMNRRKARHCAP